LFEKEITMTRKSTAAFIAVLLVFVLACNLVTQPIQDVQNIAGTAESFATSMPFETLQALATALPIETLSALPTTISEIGNYFDPQGTPVAEWNGIPIMPQATAGQEFDPSNYSFKFTGTAQDASTFYADALGKAGWSPMVTTTQAEGALLVYTKDDEFLTLTVTSVEGGIVVWMSVS
jgi:hypothetical protein